MPRSKVPPSQRQRTARACNICRRRKEKCDGHQPCGNCQDRGKQDSCRYSSPETHSTHWAPSASPRARPLLREFASHRSDSSSTMDHVLDQIIEHNAPKRRAAGDAPNSIHVDPQLPRLERLLRDDKGRYMFLGDSALSSFLQTIRRTVQDVVGSCELVTMERRHNLFQDSRSLPQVDVFEEPLIQHNQALALVEGYMLAVSGHLDLFDQSWITALLPTWIGDPNRASLHHSPVIYLSLAIGAQGRANNSVDDERAEHLFRFGRQLAVLYLMDDPSLVTVQAFSLIAYYMIAGGRTNAAFTNLGVAIRAAYAVGIHRHEANRAFRREDGISRERAWKTIRVCDLYLSAAMGRPAATSETMCNIPHIDQDMESMANREVATVEAQCNSAIFRVCHIFERILIEIYSKRTVSLELADSISGQHREWATHRSTMLKIDGLLESKAVDLPALTRKTGINHVTLAYHYSIMLLTRPFLSYMVCSSGPDDIQQLRDHPATETSCEAYAAGCVDSAIKSIDICATMAFDDRMPTRQPIMVNTVLISALCLGFAYLGNYDRSGWALGCSLRTAIDILQRLSPQCQTVKNYEYICRLLKDAVQIYTLKRDEKLLELSKQVLKRLFGEIKTREPQNVENAQVRLSLGPQHQRNAVMQDSIITTSGILANGVDASHWRQFDLGNDHGGDVEAASLSTNLNFLPFEADDPLFFATGYTPLDGDGDSRVSHYS